VQKREIDTDKLIQMYNDGATHPQLCAEFHICPGTLLNRIKQLDLPRRKKTLSVDIEEFSAAYYEGLSSRQLSKKFGICPCTANKIVKKLRLRENALHRMELYIPDSI
jgi:hypothetical protein